MKRIILTAFLLAALLATPLFAVAEEETETSPAPTAGETAAEAGKPAKPLTVDEILDRVENRFEGAGITAQFDQESTIKAMDITDTATGKLFVKRPDRMKWVYETPEEQIIVTDGDALWVYRPADNQVMTGSAPAYFGDGKGASFLSDIRVIREKFDVAKEESDAPDLLRLKLTPKEKKLDIDFIHLFIRRDTFEIARIATYNSFGDETLITLKALQFDQKIDDSVFDFTIPEGADIVHMEQ